MLKTDYFSASDMFLFPALYNVNRDLYIQQAIKNF